MEYLLILTLLAIWNGVTFFQMGYDKRMAIMGKRRIRERTLLFSAFCFGGLGSFIGMLLFRHKTKHLKFQLLLPVFMTGLLLFAGWIGILYGKSIL